MREVMLLLKASSSLSDGIVLKSRRIFIGVLVMFMIMSIVLISVITQTKDYSSMVINFMNMVNFSTLYIISFGNVYRANKANVKYDFLQFAVQLPVSKKSFSRAKFVLIWFGMLPSLVVLLYQNIICYVKGLTGFTGYIGFCTILLCLEFLTLSAVTGFNSYLDPKSFLSKLLNSISIAVVFILAMSIFASIGLNNREMYYGVFGSGFAGMFEKLEFFSMSRGGAFVVVCIAISYFLECVLPDRLLGRKGWKV